VTKNHVTVIFAAAAVTNWTAGVRFWHGQECCDPCGAYPTFYPL